jgi:hypothetical protein
VEDYQNAFSIGIFQNQRLAPVNGAPVEVAPGEVPRTYTFQILNRTAIPTAIVGLNPWDQFTTDIDMDQEVEASPLTTPDFGFPFDLVGHYTTIMRWSY